MGHYIGRNKFAMSHPKFLSKLLNLFLIYIVCHIKAGWFLKFCWKNCLFVWNVIFYRIITTPPYICATQIALNRLKLPKNFYSEFVPTTHSSSRKNISASVAESQAASLRTQMQDNGEAPMGRFDLTTKCRGIALAGSVQLPCLNVHDCPARGPHPQGEGWRQCTSQKLVVHGFVMLSFNQATWPLAEKLYSV